MSPEKHPPHRSPSPDVREESSPNLSFLSSPDGRIFLTAGGTTRRYGFPGATSLETCLRGELATYSRKTLELYRDHLLEEQAGNINGPEMTLEYLVRQYGYRSLEEAERKMEEKPNPAKEGSSNTHSGAAQTADFVKNQMPFAVEIEILKYHPPAIGKHEALGEDYLLADAVQPSEEKMREIQESIAKSGLNCRYESQAAEVYVGVRQFSRGSQAPP